MSDLTEALERFDYWLWDYYPNIFKSLPKGLTLEEIEEDAQSLLFDLPKEIQELYQWKNGGPPLFYSHFCPEGLVFYSLSKAVQITHELTGSEYVGNFLERKQINNAFFMFRSFERWLHFADCSDDEVSPILLLTDDPHLRISYTSLTSMVLTAVECYEKNILDFTDFGIELNNLEEYISILKKHNSGDDLVRKQYGIKLPLQGYE
jgi:hypothetical protein